MLRLRSHEVAVALRASGHGRGSRVAIIGGMTPEAVATYLAVVLVGGAVVSVADSFSPEEMAVRLRVAEATLVVVQVRGRPRDACDACDACDAGGEPLASHTCACGSQLCADDSGGFGHSVDGFWALHFH